MAKIVKFPKLKARVTKSKLKTSLAKSKGVRKNIKLDSKLKKTVIKKNKKQGKLDLKKSALYSTAAIGSTGLLTDSLNRSTDTDFKISENNSDDFNALLNSYIKGGE